LEPKSAAFPGRACGTCSLCCKLIEIEELHKPEGKWCPHCEPGKRGCLIYEDRPPSCRGFHCGWLQSDSFGSEWKPTTSKMVLAPEQMMNGDRLTVYVDPSFPTAWRNEPYHSQLTELALRMAGTAQLLIRINDRVIALLPDKEVDLGLCKKDDQIITRRIRATGAWEVVKIPASGNPS
jgi:hypothetical protein